MIKKCIGCGIKLQSNNEEKLGYVKKEKINEAKYCERCYKMIHYNDVKSVSLPNNLKDILSEVSKNKYFVFYMVDLFNLNEEVIETYKKIKNKKCLVISKIDILPKSFNLSKITSWIKETYKITGEIIFISSLRKVNIGRIYKVLDENNMKKAYIMGYTNCGKSTLINSLTSLDEITTSPIPNTTLDFINIKIDGYELIDSPGFILSNTFIEANDFSNLRKMNIKKYIKPRNYQLKPTCSIIVENRLRITNLGEKNSFTFYVSNLIDLKKVWDKNDTLKERLLKTYHVKPNTDIVIKGFGFINVKKECDVNIYITNHKLIELRDSFLGSEYYE